MAVAEDMRGPWVQIAHQLRYTTDNGGPDRLSARPREGKRGDWRAFLDDPEAKHGADPGPTLVTFRASDAVDVPALLRQGALRAPRPDQLPPSKAKPKGGA